MKLLCIDSEPAYHEIISLYAQKEGLIATFSDTYDGAINAYKTSLPDLVILDVIMTGGRGVDLVKEFKALAGPRFIPIIFLASHTSDSVMEKCFEAGADDFIPKPFNELLFNIRLKTHIRHLELIKEMYTKNKTLTYYQTVIEREHDMASQVLNHIQNRNEKNSERLAITKLSAASFNGDLALVKTLKDKARLIFVGDFTGHGLPASIGALPLMQAFFDNADSTVELHELAVKMNNILLSILPDYMFCAGYLIYISEKGEITYWGGGMPNAIIRRKSGKVDYLSSSHMPLGVLPASQFDSTIMNSLLNKDDTLIIISDGVPELKNEKNKMLGEIKAETLITEIYANNSLLSAQQEMKKELMEYLGNAIQFDDITLVALRT